MAHIHHIPVVGRKASGFTAVFAAILAISCIGALDALPAAASASSQLVISGAGDGHGVGMSQYGALGFAQHGYGYREILSHYYPGTALSQAPAGQIVRVLVGSTVQSVPLETYVRGVISAEMPASWPLAALEAQAVAARTYALTSDAGGKRFDVYADTRSQVYKGKAAETAATNSAAAETAGQIVTYEGKPATTYYDASSGGQTEAVQDAFPGTQAEPWLQSVSDPYESGPLHSWTVSLSFASVSKDLGGLLKGSFSGIEVLKRGASPRVLSANLLGSKGTTTVTGDQLAERLGLDSTWAYFSVKTATKTTSEPDRSGRTAPAPSSTTPPVSPAPTTSESPASPGTPAPAEVAAPVAGPSTSAATGGVPAE